MQTTRSESQQTGQKVSPSGLSDVSIPLKRSFSSTKKFRFALFAAVFYPYLLFFAAFLAVLTFLPPTMKVIINAVGAFVATVVLFFVSCRLLSSLLRERSHYEKEIAKARRLAQISDVLNGSVIGIREKVRTVGRLLAQEGGTGGWRCRIVIESIDSFLPPSSERLGFHLPMTVDDQKVGALIVTTGKQPLDDIDLAFFNALTRMLALFIHKEKMWEEFHSDLEKMEAMLLLRSESMPDGNVSEVIEDHRTVEHMLHMMGLVRGVPSAQKQEALAFPPRPRFTDE